MMTNKVAVISGGAGQIGQAVALRLAMHGVRIFSLVRRDLQSSVDRSCNLPNAHLQHQALLVDVRDSKQIQCARDTVEKLAGRCDILINAAGISLPTQTPLDTTDEIFDEMIATNLRGTWAMTREFYPLLAKSDESLVINLSSASSVAPRAGSLGYSISKAGINVMTECLAKFLGPNVRFVAIAPSALPRGTSGQPKVDPNAGSEFHSTIKQNTPLKRLCTAEDVADVVESLVTKMHFYNGHLIVLDGGFTL